MGAALMTNPKIELLLKQYRSVRECVSCSGVMVPSTITYEKQYQGVTLLIKNFPTFKCLEDTCGEVIYGSGSLLKAIRKAKKNYEMTGEVVYKYESEL
ncbi:YgiT-type zinc finger protein [Peribacillus frigoritolerans]|uniref:YgiT-type zinc finger protein n=1 Tax=Peribacillus frigoritolerans TaxID=450367 RepID=UPI002B244EB5|nr:YgiT-type zinc finger protein [Peribacillus frigoritolerans]MEB2631967.1 YgiT-type zinc finger protein [Peribacillus frigoritolerans]